MKRFFIALSLLLTPLWATEICKLRFHGISGNLGFLECKNLESNSTYKVEVKKGSYTLRFFAHHPAGRDLLPFAVPMYWSGNLTLVLHRDGLILASVPLKVKPLKVGVSRIRFGRTSHPSKRKTSEPTSRRKKAYNLLRKVLRTFTLVRFYEAKPIFPLRTYKRVSSPFGVKRIVNGRAVGFHKGVDLAAPYGTSVLTSLSGRVVLARYLPLTGNTVVIDHGWGLMTLYAHLSEVEVKEGNLVKQGQVIGKVGSTGRSTGPHLHFGVYLNDVAVDPLSFLKMKLKPAGGGNQSSSLRTLKKASCDS